MGSTDSGDDIRVQIIKVHLDKPTAAKLAKLARISWGKSKLGGFIQGLRVTDNLRKETRTRSATEAVVEEFTEASGEMTERFSLKMDNRELAAFRKIQKWLSVGDHEFGTTETARAIIRIGVKSKW